MGAFGSGRFGRRLHRRRVEDVSAGDVIRLRDLMRQARGRGAVPPEGITTGTLSIGCDDGLQLIDLVSHPQPFGGRRWWLVCPHCRRRCAALFVREAGRSVLVRAAYACRACLRIPYRSENLTREKRLRHRATRFYRRAGLTMSDLSEGAPSRRRPLFRVKPKHVHWSRFARLCAAADAYVQRADEMLLRSLQRTRGPHPSLT